jgi:gluconate kinase
MPASLLRSQFETLEVPAADERAITVSIDARPQAIVDRVLAELGLAGVAPDLSA